MLICQSKGVAWTESLHLRGTKWQVAGEGYIEKLHDLYCALSVTSAAEESGVGAACSRHSRDDECAKNFSWET
jgi:hypothetical protein